METKANHFLIGLFLLLFMAATAGFVLWLTRASFDREYAYYDIYFRETVSGLGPGGDVRFNGIKVGSVDGIAFDEQDPGRVRVTVRITDDTPVRLDSYATLEIQGLTGVAFVQISGGTLDSPRLEAHSRPPFTVIASRPSRFAELFQGAPDIINRVADLLSEDNRRAIAGTLSDLRVMAATLAVRSENIDRTLLNLESASSEMAGTFKAARAAAQQVDALAANDAKAAIQDVRKMTQSFSKLADELHAIAAENRAPLNTLMTDGVADVRSLADEMRVLVQSLARLSERLEADPSQILYGARPPEFAAPAR